MKNARIQEIKSLELGIIGCARANKLVEVLSKATCDVTITAILDIDDDILDDFHSKNPNIAKFSCEKKFFSSGLFEAIYIASPAHLHFNHSLLAIKYNKHTLCEVPAVQNINQGLILFKKFKNANLTYMMAENFCFTPTNMAISQLFKDGFFGAATFIRTGYIHNCKSLAINSKTGDLTWRGVGLTKTSGNDYPTHSLGPVCKWLGIGTGQDRFLSITSFASQEISLSQYYAENYPIRSGSQNNLFKRGDVSVSILKTASGAIVELVLDTVSNRPSNMAEIVIQGSKGSFISGRFDGEPSIISSINTTQSVKADEYEDFDPLIYLSTKDTGIRKKLGRLFPFYKVLENFRASISNQAEPIVTIEDAFLWSSIIELSKKSILRGSIEIEFPASLKNFQL